MAFRILVVDDHRPIFDLITAAFRRDMYQFEYAASGPAAVSTLRRSAFELLIVDGEMPGQSGPALLRELGANRPTAIGLTGSLAMIDQLRDAGCLTVLRKPFFLAPLEDVLTTLQSTMPVHVDGLRPSAATVA